MDAYNFLKISYESGDIIQEDFRANYCVLTYDLHVGDLIVAKNIELEEVTRFLEDWENFEKGTFIVFPRNFVRKFERYILSKEYRGKDPSLLVRKIYKEAENIPDEILDELPDEFFKYVTKPVSYNTTVRVYSDEA